MGVKATKIIRRNGAAISREEGARWGRYYGPGQSGAKK
jgi:hypothetical protein